MDLGRQLLKLFKGGIVSGKEDHATRQRVPERLSICGGELGAADVKHDGTERHQMWLFLENDKGADQIELIAYRQMMARYAFIPGECAQIRVKREIGFTQDRRGLYGCGSGSLDGGYLYQCFR